MNFFQQTNAINNTILKWFINRSKDQSSEITLNRKIIYILPTRYGIFFSFVLLVMLSGSVNYSNSMGFLLTFLLSGLSISGMLYTYRNLLALKISPCRPEPVFCGKHATFEFTVNFENSHNRYSINYGLNRIDYHTFDIQKGESIRIFLSIPTTHRGSLTLGPLRLWTKFPLGIFHVWSWVDPKPSIIVYPKPEGLPLKLNTKPHGNNRKQATQTGYDDYAGMRKYTPGDSLKHIAWKAVAKGHDLHTKQYLDFNSDQIWFDWDKLPCTLSTEQKLSQLCLWVLEANSKSLAYGLRLPAVTIEPAWSETHKAKCLTSLALFKS